MAFSARSVWVRLHRIVGLATAGFLFLSGITGSLIAFWPELDVALNPDLYVASSHGERLSPSALAARIEAVDVGAQVVGVPLRLAEGEAAVVFLRPRGDPATGENIALGYEQAFVDPVNGELLGRRLWGACCFQRKHFIPFIHTLHYTLYLPGRVGVWVMGVVAIVWFFDCFVAIGLTFPRRRPFLSRWGASFRIAREARGGRLLLDLHRASGLWLWLVLAILAMSGAALNLYAEVFRPVVSYVLPVTDEFVPPKAKPGAQLIGFDAAVVLGSAEAARRGWERPGAVYYDPAAGTYIVSFQRSQQDRGDGLGISALIFDGVTGALLDAHIHGIGRIGDYVLEAQFPLHSGRLLGLPGRIIVCATGLAVAVLSMTGVMMWARRRRAQAITRRQWDFRVG